MVWIIWIWLTNPELFFCYYIFQQYPQVKNWAFSGTVHGHIHLFLKKSIKAENKGQGWIFYNQRSHLHRVAMHSIVLS